MQQKMVAKQLRMVQMTPLTVIQTTFSSYLMKITCRFQSHRSALRLRVHYNFKIVLAIYTALISSRLKKT